jgi:hypothetical protein
MQPHQERVVAEKRELDEKLVKLGAFLEGSFFPTLSADEQGRLTEQASVMKRYSEILGDRIAAF